MVVDREGVSWVATCETPSRNDPASVRPRRQTLTDAGDVDHHQAVLGALPPVVTGRTGNRA